MSLSIALLFALSVLFAISARVIAQRPSPSLHRLNALGRRDQDASSKQDNR
jgi:hypothetical protein